MAPRHWFFVSVAILVKLIIFVALVNAIWIGSRRDIQREKFQLNFQDRQVLSALREHFSLDRLNDSPWSDAVNPCTWYGITCMKDQSHVIALYETCQICSSQITLVSPPS
jgi:hypothetical protein